MKTWLKIVLAIIAFFFIIGIFGAIFTPSETNYQSGNEAGNEKSSLTEPLIILNHQKEYGEFGNLVITGTAENVGGKQLSYAEIRVKFYDEDNSLIDTSLDNINDLGAQEKWKFEVMYLGMDNYKVDRYEIGIGTVW